MCLRNYYVPRVVLTLRKTRSKQIYLSISGTCLQIHRNSDEERSGYQQQIDVTYMSTQVTLGALRRKQFVVLIVQERKEVVPGTASPRK